MNCSRSWLTSFSRAALCVVLLGAGRPPAGAPLVVVYPMIALRGVPDRVGSDIASVVAAELRETGTIAVKDAPADTAPADYAQTARSLGADFYVTGFVAPVGSQLSFVEQLVNTRAGSIVWSNTSQISTASDSRSQAELLGAVVASLSARAPAPSQNAAPVNASAAAIEPPKAPALPRPIAGVLIFEGSPRDLVQKYIPAKVVQTLHSRFGIDASVIPVASEQLAEFGPLLCAQTGASQLIGGQVSVSRVNGEMAPGAEFDVSLRLSGFNCADLSSKPRSFSTDVQGGDGNTAVGIAIYNALKGYLARRT